MKDKRWLFKIPAMLLWLTPIAVAIPLIMGGLDIRTTEFVCPDCGYVHEVVHELSGFNPSTVGYVVGGLLLGIICALLVIFIVKDAQYRIYLVSFFAGAVILVFSVIAVTFGIIMMVTPVAALGGSICWKLSKPKAVTQNS